MALDQHDVDAAWDFADPSTSERALRSIASAAVGADRDGWSTQVARALGLQERFAEADLVLDGVASSDPETVVRVALERGRLRNSGGDPESAIPLFVLAAEGARAGGLDFLEIDALHMLAIADAARTEQWTADALSRLDLIPDARTQRWRIALHTNLGWSAFDAGDPDTALAAFERAAAAADRFGTPQQRTWAAEAIDEARTALADRG